MTSPGYARQCGVCHVGGGQLEYDYDMKPYGDPTSNDTGGKYTYRVARVNPDGSGIPGGIILTSTNANNELYGDNKAEVDCMMCHMNELRTGAAWYKSIGCDGTPGKVGPADSPACTDSRFTFASGTIYDSFNRNIATSLGYFKQAASAGIGALINLSDGSLSNVPSTISGNNIASVPNSANCAICHARTNSDNIGLPMEAAQYGGMVTGFGNFFRITAAGSAFDFDKTDTNGTCTNCANDTQWNEFGCKTGMGKRAQKSGVGTQDRFGFGICLGCATFNAMQGDMSTGWFMGGVCAMPSVQSACNTAAGVTLQGSSGEWMGILENPATMLPKKIMGKMSDTDVHDAAHMKCSTCHYALQGDRPARTISGSSGGTNYSYTYTALTGTYSIQKIDHHLAQGYSTMEKADEILDGTLSCEGCHIDRTHPNSAGAPVPVHAGFPALHFAKIDCRTCHIPAVYSSPGRLLFRDWTAGAYRQADGSNGNANHFDFAFNFMEGAAAPMAPLKAWIATPAGIKIAPILPSMLPIWTGSAIRATDDFVLGWSPAKTRDITAAAARVAAANPGLGIRINGTNEHPLFQGFQLTDPLKIESKQKIDLMAAELATSGAGYAAHATVRDPRINLFPTMFDPSHGIAPKEWALGSSSQGGCVMCHSSSNPASPDYSDRSVGFFDGKKDLLKNGMMQMADYDCGEDGAAGPAMMFCANFDNPAYGGNGNAVCETTELMACKTYIGGQLFQQFGMPGDIAAAFPIDGIDMMQMQAVREGATAAGCNPIYSFFGMPNATARGQLGTNGCVPALGDYYSRDEIRLHYKKNLQQSTFAPVVAGSSMASPTTNAIITVPSTLNRVYGVVSVGKNPSNAAHVNKFDLGATCITDPMTGATGPCTNGGYVNTTVSERQLLGYSDVTTADLMSPSTAGYQKPLAAFTAIADATTSYKVNFNAGSSLCANIPCTYSWSFTNTTPGAGSGTTLSRIFTGPTGTATLTVTDANGFVSSTSKPIVAGVVNAAPVAVNNLPASTSTAPITVTNSTNNVTFTDASTDADGNITTVTVNWGDGNVDTGTQGSLFTHNYTRAAKFSILHTVRDASGLSNVKRSYVSIVPQKYVVSGTVRVNGLPASGVYVYLKYNGRTKAGVPTTTGSPNYTFPAQLPGSYTMTLYKAGCSFTNPGAINLTGNMTVDVTGTCP
jgi:hypothetical protein